MTALLSHIFNYTLLVNPYLKRKCKILLKIFNPVKNAEIPIKIIETIVPDIAVSKPRALHILEII